MRDVGKGLYIGLYFFGLDFFLQKKKEDEIYIVMSIIYIFYEYGDENSLGIISIFGFNCFVFII